MKLQYMCLDFSLFSDRACAAWASLMYVVNLEMDNSPKMGFFKIVSGQITSDALWK